MEQAASNSSWKGNKFWLTVLGLVLITTIVIVALVRDRIVNQQQWQVSVTGQGKIEYQSDIANIRLGIEINRVDQADEALSQLNERMDKVLAAIKALGIEEADIQTQSYSLYPQYDYVNEVSVNLGVNQVSETPVLSGYTANQQLMVKVKNIDENSKIIGELIAQATQAGANQVLGVTFDVSNLEELKLQARTKAIEDAREKSVVLADAADIKLKNIVGWWENIISSPGANTYYAEGYGGGDAKGGVPTGKQEIIIEMNLTYGIK